jgi:hypothetical protein
MDTFYESLKATDSYLRKSEPREIMAQRLLNDAFPLVDDIK